MPDAVFDSVRRFGQLEDFDDQRFVGFNDAIDTDHHACFGRRPLLLDIARPPLSLPPAGKPCEVRQSKFSGAVAGTAEVRLFPEANPDLSAPSGGLLSRGNLPKSQWPESRVRLSTRVWS